MTFLLYFGLFFLVVSWAAEFEMRSLEDPRRYALVVGVLTAAGILIRRHLTAHTQEAKLQFEETLPPAVLVLGLQRD